MDYLLRDSHYCGVEYGTYDLDKLIESLTVVSIEGNSVLAIRQNGIQAVEGFILARYWMFIQVYFHKYRRLFDYYLSSFTKELLTLECEKSGQYPKSLDEYLKMDDFYLYEKIKYYARKHPNKDEAVICDFAKRLYTRSHHKVVFDPPYVHYDSRSGSGNEDYQRLNFVKDRLQKYLATIDPSENNKIYIDLATGSATKNFGIEVYNEEYDPDDSHEPKKVEIPAIPVLSKHNGKTDAIQKYSFVIKSISDVKISILRIYAEGNLIDDMRIKCEDWFTKEYNTYMEDYKKTTIQIEQIRKELRKYEKHQSELENTLGLSEAEDIPQDTSKK